MHFPQLTHTHMNTHSYQWSIQACPATAISSYMLTFYHVLLIKLWDSDSVSNPPSVGPQKQFNECENCEYGMYTLRLQPDNNTRTTQMFHYLQGQNASFDTLIFYLQRHDI